MIHVGCRLTLLSLNAIYSNFRLIVVFNKRYKDIPSEQRRHVDQ